MIKSVKHEVDPTEFDLYMSVIGRIPRENIVAPIWNAMGYFCDIIRISLYRDSIVRGNLGD